MANRKVTPLKDEPGTSLEDIQVEQLLVRTMPLMTRISDGLSYTSLNDMAGRSMTCMSVIL